MTTREIKYLSPALQNLYNRLHDKVRRDEELRKEDVQILLTCTSRTKDECNKIGMGGKPKIGRIPSEAFEAVCLKYGIVSFMDDRIVEHAKNIGLCYDNGSFSIR